MTLKEDHPLFLKVFPAISLTPKSTSLTDMTLKDPSLPTENVYCFSDLAPWFIL